jgi:quercetin dioxygenase-like cupin family protein
MSSNLKKFVKCIDDRGDLIAFNSLSSTNVKRCFLITCKKDAWRGRHYHKNTTQTICVAKGLLEVQILDGLSTKTLNLNEGDVFIQEPGIQFEFKSLLEESIIIVLCDTDHDPEDYYRHDS